MTEERYENYTRIRNEYGIGNYAFERKWKYSKTNKGQKRKIEMIENYHKEVSEKGLDECREYFTDEYCYGNLLTPKNYLYIDIYVAIIENNFEKTDMNKRSRFFSINYYDVWKLNKETYKKYEDFMHNGCFYIAMLHLGYQFKRINRETFRWNCKEKK